jgi:hypothetical protein
MSLESLNIIGKDTLRAPPALCLLEARHSNGQASVAWFNSATAAQSDPSRYIGTIPNGEKVELIDANADGQHVYATVRWRSQEVALRTVHLVKLPVQLHSHDGQPRVAFFENLVAAQRNTPAGYLPNSSTATVDNANLDGHYTFASLNLPMGTRVMRCVDLQGLPQRNFPTPADIAAPAAPVNQPPTPLIPAQIMPIHQADLLLYSEVGVRHVEGKPFVGYYFDKTSAQLMGTPHGTIPSDSTALLLELDAPNLGAGGHCKIKFKQNGCQLDAYIGRGHIFSRS